MKKLSILFVLLLSSCSPSVYFDYLISPKFYPSIEAEQVKFFLTEKELPEAYEKIVFLGFPDKDTVSYNEPRMYTNQQKRPLELHLTAFLIIL